jgi:hypothetical protein
MLFGFTAAAHAGMVPPVTDPPCHDQAADHHRTPAPTSQQALMPCCSQPVVIAPSEVFVPSVAHIEHLSLTPALVLKLSGLTPARDPPPPKSM